MSSDGSAFTLITFVEYSRDNPAAQPTERLTGTMRLPLPQNVPDSSTLSIDGEKLGILGMIDSDTPANIEKFAKNFNWDNFNWGELARTVMLFAPGLSDSVIGNAFNRYIGQVKNPHMTAIFEGVNLRRHSFQWRFAPRSRQDAEELERIYKEIKIRTHPKAGLNGFALNYPEQVYITFPNTKLTPVRKSFILNVNIGSGTGDQIALFEDGTPVERTLTLDTLEVDIITRDELEGNGAANTDDPNTIINGSGGPDDR